MMTGYIEIIYSFGTFFCTTMMVVASGLIVTGLVHGWEKSEYVVSWYIQKLGNKMEGK